MWGGTIGANTGARNANRCRHVAVRMSDPGGSSTLAQRIAACTDAADRAYPWYDVIYIGNGMGWGLDYRHVQQHYCIPKGWNVSTTERQMGTTRHVNGAAADSDLAYKVETTGWTASIDGDKRLAIVNNPFKAGGKCLLLRCRSSDPMHSGNVRRAALRQYGHSVSPYNSSNNPDQWLTDRMPRDREFWFGGAYLYGDDPSFDQGETESWAGADTTGGTREVCGWQMHQDNGDATSVISGTGTMEEPPSPSLMLGVKFTNGGAESTLRLIIRRARPAVQGERLRNMYVSDSGTGVSGGSENSDLWTSGVVPLRTKWLGFVVRVLLSHENTGIYQVWHNELDTTFNSTPIVDAQTWNDYDVGPWGIGFYSNASGKRNNPQHRRGDYYHCPAEIYMAHNPMQLPSMTMRCIPVRFHERNPARTSLQYAEDLMTLLKAAAY